MQKSISIEIRREALRLTAREFEILAWVSHGMTNPEIARILRISPHTVRKHLENIYEKLGVHTRAGAVSRLLGGIDPHVA